MNQFFFKIYFNQLSFYFRPKFISLLKFFFFKLLFKTNSKLMHFEFSFSAFKNSKFYIRLKYQYSGLPMELFIIIS